MLSFCYHNWRCTMRFAICDDDPCFLRSLTESLLSLRSDAQISPFTSAGELLSANQNFDIVFLDIDMPSMSGMDAAKYVRDNNISDYIIFITGHSEFMQEAFKVRAFRYINKPFSTDELQSAIFDAEKDMLPYKKIVIREQAGVTAISLSDIVCIEAFGDGTYIHTRSGSYICQTTLKTWCAQLSGDHFFQTHKSFLVALRYVSRIGKGEAELEGLKLKVPVSRRKYSLFKDAFLDYIKNNALNM